MAFSSFIRGITIEIGGNTDPLSKALYDVTVNTRAVQKELKAVNEYLKLDPSNVEKAAQKQKLLAEAVEIARNKLDALKQAQVHVEEQFKSGKMGEAEYRDFQAEVTKAEAELKKAEKAVVDFDKEIQGSADSVGDAGKELDKTGKETENLGKEMDKTSEKSSMFGDVLKATLAAEAIKAGLKFIIDGVKELGAGIKEYITEGSRMADTAAESQAKLTQVMRVAIGATDEEIKSLVDLADEYANLGVVSKTAQTTAMAEIATFVQRKESIEEMLPTMNDYIAYQYGVTASEEQARNVATALGKAIDGNIDGLAKQGFALTKDEKDWFKNSAAKQQALLAQAELTEGTKKFTLEQEAAALEAARVAKVVKLVGTSMEGMNEALAQTDAGKMVRLNNVMQTTQQTVGKMANEFKAKIAGEMLPSITSLSDAFLGVIRGEGSIEDMSNAFSGMLDDIVSTVDTFLPELVDMGVRLIESVAEGISNNLDKIVAAGISIIEKIVPAIATLLPKLLDMGIKIIIALIDGIAKSLPQIIKAVADMIPQLIKAIVDNLSLFIKAGIDLILALANGLLDAVPQLLAALPHIIKALLDEILKSIPLLIDAGVQLLISLVTALPKIIATIIAAVPQIIASIVTAVIQLIPLIIQAGIDLLVSLIQALPEIISEVVTAIPIIVQGFVDAIFNNIPLIIQAGIDLLVALVENLPEIIVEVVKAITPIIAGLVGAIKDSIPQIVSAGSDLIKGLWQGIVNVKDWIMGKIRGYMNDIVKNIKSFFGISSPSKLFADEIGKMLPQGIGVGFELETPNLKDNIIDNLEALTAGIHNTLETETAKLSIPVTRSETYGGGQHQPLEDNAVTVTKILLDFYNAFMAFDGDFSERMAGAMENMSIKYDNREFARLVRESV